MRERIVRFGPGECLCAVLAEPDPSNVRRGAPVVVLANVGMHTRIGPNRMWVLLARARAAEGWSVLRFDHSGLGDSAARGGALSDLERAGLEQREAVRFLVDRHAASGVLLVGFCSGVDGVHLATVAEPKVAGAVYLDGYAYPTRSFHLRRWTLRLLEGRVWRASLQRRLGKLKDRLANRPPVPPPVYDRTYPPPADLARDLRAVVARGARLLFLWSEGREHEFNHPGQFFEMLAAPDLRGRVEVDVLSGCDHLFTNAAARDKLFARMRSWLGAQFPAA
jgi:dienelactone hydrolase